MGLLQDKVVLITGSSRGIGAAIAQLFAREGATVAVHGRDKAALARVREDIVQAGGRAIEVVGDVTKFAELEAIRRNTEAELGAVNILVANAGANLPRRAFLSSTLAKRAGTPLSTPTSLRPF